jgi:hypothetical protein
MVLLPLHPDAPLADALPKLEEAIKANPFYNAALNIGKPRGGHPEGSLRNHIAQILGDISKDHPLRPELRVIAWLHDVGKLALVRGNASYWPNGRPSEELLRKSDEFARMYHAFTEPYVAYHAGYSEMFARDFFRDPPILSVIRYHDTGFRFWKEWRKERTINNTQFDRIYRNVDLTLLLHFNLVDGVRSKGPVYWLESELVRRGFLSAPVLPGQPRSRCG